MRVLKVGGEIITSAPKKCDLHQEPYIYYSGFFSYWYTKIIPQFGGKIFHMDDHENGVIMQAVKERNV